MWALILEFNHIKCTQVGKLPLFFPSVAKQSTASLPAFSLTLICKSLWIEASAKCIVKMKFQS